MELKFDEKIINVVFKYLDTGMEKFASSVIVMMSIFAIFDLWISLTSELTDFGRALKKSNRIRLLVCSCKKLFCNNRCNIYIFYKYRAIIWRRTRNTWCSN